MHRVTKVILVLVGISFIVLAGFEISRSYPIPLVTGAYITALTRYPATFEIVLLVLGIVVGLVGLMMIIVGIFRPVKVRRLTFNNHIGQLEIPANAIERDLQYQLTQQYQLIDTQAKVQLRGQSRGKVRITAGVNSGSQFDELAQKVSQTAVDYLQQRLELKVIKPVVQLTPAVHQEKVTVL